MAECIIQIGGKWVDFGVQHVLTSSSFLKERAELLYIIRKINDKLRVLCYLHNFHFVLNANISRIYLCADDAQLIKPGTELFAGNIVAFLNDFILNVNMNGFLNWHSKV